MLPATAFGWWMLIGLALVSHAAGQGLIAYALAHLPAAFSSVSLLFQPVMAALFAWLLLSEALVPLQIAGGIVVLARHLPRAPRLVLDHDAVGLAARAFLDGADLVDRLAFRLQDARSAAAACSAGQARPPCRCRS